VFSLDFKVSINIFFYVETVADGAHLY